MKKNQWEVTLLDSSKEKPLLKATVGGKSHYHSKRVFYDTVLLPNPQFPKSILFVDLLDFLSSRNLEDNRKNNGRKERPEKEIDKLLKEGLN